MLPVAMRPMALDSRHDDYVHDVVYDYYGKRIATCSSDQRIQARVCEGMGVGGEGVRGWLSE